MANKFQCKNCGACCTIVPIRREEKEKIRKYLLKHPDIAETARNKKFSATCVFRDEKNGKCLIYSCRPLICQYYKCEDPNWSKDLTVVELRKGKSYRKGDAELINGLFGDPSLRDMYRNFMKVEALKLTLETKLGLVNPKNYL